MNTPENRTKVKAFIRDGCSTNTAAINMLRHFGFSHMMDIKCISHASSNVGKVLHESCKLGTKFVHRFNKMMNVSSEARKVFRELISTEVKRYTSDIRWFYIQEVSSQLFKFWPRVIELINNTGSFSKEIRTKLKNMIEDNEKDIRLELALFEDAAVPLARLCYFQEGDGFLSPTTYDHWHKVLSLLHDYVDTRKVLSNVKTIATVLHPQDPLARDAAITRTRLKLNDCVVKMFSSTNDHDKLLSTLNTLRAFRLLDYRFIAKSTLPSLYRTEDDDLILGEITQLLGLPDFRTDENELKPYIQELSLYHRLSQTEVALYEDAVDTVKAKVSTLLLSFWAKHVIELPYFSTLAKKVATISPSSATVERLFSLLASFNDNQSNALADYCRNRVVIRYNELFRSGVSDNNVIIT